MNKALILIIVLFSSMIHAQTGQKNFIDQNYIQVEGIAEMNVIPDQIE